MILKCAFCGTDRPASFEIERMIAGGPRAAGMEDMAFCDRCYVRSILFMAEHELDQAETRRLH